MLLAAIAFAFQIVGYPADLRLGCADWSGFWLNEGLTTFMVAAEKGNALWPRRR